MVVEQRGEAGIGEGFGESEVVGLSKEALTNFEEIHNQVQKVGEMMVEIAAASDQQNLGIDQLNQAVESMDSAVHGAAADTEESASSAEELSSQADEMKNMVSSFRLTHAKL